MRHKKRVQQAEGIREKWEHVNQTPTRQVIHRLYHLYVN